MSTESHTSMTITISEALETHQDLDGLHDERLVRLHVKELFELRGAEDSGGDEDSNTLEDVWAYLLTTREQLAFLAHLCVRKGICKREELHLERFEDQGVTVAITLLLSEYEPAIALSPIADRVRRVQLAVLTSGFWDVLKLGTFEREDRLMLLG